MYLLSHKKMRLRLSTLFARVKSWNRVLAFLRGLNYVVWIK